MSEAIFPSQEVSGSKVRVRREAIPIEGPINSIENLEVLQEGPLLNIGQGANFNIPQIQIIPPNEDIVGEGNQEQVVPQAQQVEEQVMPEAQQAEEQVVPDEVGEAEEFELNVEGEGSEAELEGGIESIEATEVVGEEAAEIGSVVAETSAELGAAVATEAVEDSIPIAGWIAGGATLILIGTLGYKLAETVKKKHQLSEDETKKMDDMVKKINNIEDNIQNRINQQNGATEAIDQDIRGDVGEMLHDRYSAAKELNAMLKKGGISLFKVAEEVSSRIETLQAEKANLDKAGHEEVTLMKELGKIVDKESELKDQNKRTEEQVEKSKERLQELEKLFNEEVDTRAKLDHEIQEGERQLQKSEHLELKDLVGDNCQLLGKVNLQKYEHHELEDKIQLQKCEHLELKDFVNHDCNRENLDYVKIKDLIQNGEDKCHMLHDQDKCYILCDMFHVHTIGGEDYDKDDVIYT